MVFAKMLEELGNRAGLTPLNLRASRVAFFYAAAAILWITLSDRTLIWLIDDPERLAVWLQYKSWLFISACTLLLWVERARSDRRVEHAEKQLRTRVEERTSELERARQQLQIILDNAPVGFYMRDIHNRYMLVNRRWEEDMKIPRVQALGVSPGELFAPELAQELNRGFYTILQKKEGLLEEVSLPLHDHTGVFMRAAFPLTDEVGEIYAVMGITTEITELKAVEESLRKAEERFRAVFQSASVGINIVDPDGKYVGVNAAFQEMLGYDEASLLGRNFKDITYPPDLDLDAKVTQQIEQDPSQTREFEKRYVRRDGTLVWTRLLISAIRNEDGTLAFYVTVVEDITAHKEVELLRHRTQAELEQLVAERTVELQRVNDELAEAQRISHVGNWSLEVEGNHLQWSTEICRIFGYEPTLVENTQEIFWNALYPDDREVVSRNYHTALEGQQALDFEHRIVRPNGEIRILHERGYVVRDESAHPLRIFGTMQDVTEHRETEAEIRAVNARLSAILHASPLAIIALDAQGRVQLWNLAAEDVYGYSATELLGKQMPDMQAPGDSAYFQIRQRILSGESLKNLETRRKRGDGAVVDVSISTAPLLDADGTFDGTVALVADITERKRTREALRASEERFARIFYSTPYPIGYGDTNNGLLFDVNERFADFFGYSRQEMIGRSIHEFDVWVNPQERSTLFYALLEHGFALDYELQVRRKDGSVRDISLSTYRLNLDGQEVAIGMFSDITERKQAIAEVQRLNQGLEASVAERTAHLEQQIAERMRAESAVMELNATLAQQAEHLVEVNRELETFTYSVSHDLKAPLRGIDGYSRLLLEDYGTQLDEEGRYFLSTIRTATIHMAQLIDDLLSYSRLERRTLALSQIDVRAIVADLLLLVLPEQTYPQTNLVVSLDQGLVCADSDALMLVLRNLLDNALKFSAAAPAPRVEIGGQINLQGYQLFVRDNGVGFNMQYHERIFDIFQRLHRTEDYPGTGIGLAIVRKGLQRMHGRVWAESQPGEGATFYVEIPI
jgi:PAS domain S-box-containing protein